MKMTYWVASGTAAAALVALVCASALAAIPGEGGGDPAPPKSYFEQGILSRSGEVIEPLGPDLMGDAINVYSGDVLFTQTDVTLPGNNALIVSAGRRRALGAPQTYGGGLFGDWDLDIPRLHTVATQREPNWYGGGSASNFNRCSQFYYPPSTYVVTGVGSLYYDHRSFWGGYHLYVPGSGDQTLLARSAANTTHPSDGTATTYPIVTKNHWQLSCLPALENGAGEGFLARSPDGTTYRFDHIAVRTWSKAKVAWRSGAASGTAFMDRSQVSIFPTLVTDRFGNWVRYTYGGTDGWRVMSITSSDGRTITFTYNGNRIGSASDGIRTWSYGYSGTGSLQTVTQPDGSQWQFALEGVSTVPFSFPDPDCDGGENGTIDFTARTGTITHPSGAVGAFTLKSTYHGRSGVTGSQTYCGMTSNPVSRYFVSRSLASKTLSGPGMPAMTWSYSYSIASGSFAPCNGCVNTKTVTITDPRGDVTVNTYGTLFGVNEGLLLSSAEGASGSSSLRSTSFAYASPSAGPYPGSVGGVNQAADAMSRIHTPQSQRTIAQQGVNFTQQVTAFDLYARAASVTRSSSLGYSKTESTSYHDNTSLWVLGQVASRSVGGTQVSSTTYSPGTALPSASYKFGKLNATYAFNGDGTLYSLTDGRNYTTTFNSYKRGLPQSILFPDGRGISAVVNDIGKITSATNEAGTTWSFGYDAMGRLASKTPPGGDAVAYHPTTLAFVQVPTTEYGLEANHWRQTITTGNAVTINYFDARWRKRLTHTYDASNIAATQRMQRYDYDAYNRTTFAAYPARSIASIAATTPGTATSYDALGRPTQTVADSELGLLTTTTQYLSNFQKRMTDARANVTTTSFQVFDEPSEDAISSIAAPEGLNVTISRDIFGKPLSITRSGTYAGAPLSATRAYVYDANQLLCKTVEPETGATIQMLDGANNVAWRAPGLGLTGTSSCDWASVPAASQIAYTYDPRNRVTGTGFGDGSPTIGRSYTADGLPLTVVSNGSTWTYGYNNRRLLTSESLAYGQSFTMGRAHDAYGNLSQLTYPDGAAVAYGPNALGESTQVSGYASAVTYHPNGAVAGYALANGIVHSLTQNTRGLPLVNRDAGVLQDQYGYDANGNVAAITDQQEGIASRSLGYDGLDRLTVANSPGVWGNASYGYDLLGNVRSSVVGSRNTAHTYGANNLLASLTVNGAVTGYAYDARGNVTGRGTQGFFFDIGNRMSLANGVASYSYDGHGRRVSVSGTNGVTKTHVYSQAGQLLYGQARQGMSTWLTRYVYLGDKLIAETDSSAGTSYSHTDALGSPVARTNGSGQLINRTRYEPYGKTAAGTDPGSNGFTGIGFTGHVNDAETGLVYMQQRYYDPLAGRFLSVDPVVTDAHTGKSFARYEYANSNPYKFKDPDGRFANFAVGFVVGAAIEAVAQYAITGSVGDLKAVAIAGVGGAITGGVGGALAKAATAGSITSGAAVHGTAATGAVTGGAGKVAESVASGKPVSAGEVAAATVGGGIGAGVGGKIANAGTAKLEKAAAAEGITGHVGQTTQAAIQQGGRVGATTSAYQEAGKVGADLTVSATQKKLEQK